MFYILLLHLEPNLDDSSIEFLSLEKLRSLVQNHFLLPSCLPLHLSTLLGALGDQDGICQLIPLAEASGGFSQLEDNREAEDRKRRKLDVCNPQLPPCQGALSGLSSSSPSHSSCQISLSGQLAQPPVWTAPSPHSGRPGGGVCSPLLLCPGATSISLGISWNP